MKIRQDKIGIKTTSTVHGCAIKVGPEHAELFFKQGRFDLLEDEDRPDQLKPVSDMSVKELRSMAKDMPGYKKTLTKSKLIDLIHDASPTAK